MKRARTIIESFNYAISGIIYALRTQRNMKIHFITAIFVIIASSFFDFTTVELLAIFFAIALVIISEMVNTAIETTVDLVTSKYHPLAKIAKNVAAAAVLIAAVNSLIVGYLIFYHRFEKMTNTFLFKARNCPEYIFLVSITLVIILVIIIKLKHGKGTPFRGGMLSGHTAVAFAITTAIFFTASTTVFFLTILMALLVAESRLETGIHTLAEVILGAVLGTAITSFLFLFSK